MKTKYLKKLERYVTANELPKLKSYVKKHRINVNEFRDKDDNTILHIACSLGHDAIVCFLLQKGCDPLLSNNVGNLPLHLACYFAKKSSDKHVYTDLILPLLKHSPSSIDQVNIRGVSSRQLLQDFKYKLAAEYEDSDSSTDVSSDDDDEEAWRKKMADALDEDYGESFGAYDKDYQYEGRKPDTYDNWADSISHKYHEKNSRTRHSQSNHRKREGPSLGEGSGKRPKISEEKREEFAKKLQEEYRRIKELRHIKGIEEKVRTRACYDEKCKIIFSGKIKTKLKFTDIPWPHEEGSDLSSITDFLFCDMEKGSKGYRKYLKEQQVKWHPDRFIQKCGNHICDKHRDQILSKVIQVSQALNGLSEDLI